MRSADAFSDSFAILLLLQPLAPPVRGCSRKPCYPRWLRSHSIALLSTGSPYSPSLVPPGTRRSLHTMGPTRWDPRMGPNPCKQVRGQPFQCSPRAGSDGTPLWGVYRMTEGDGAVLPAHPGYTRPELSSRGLCSRGCRRRPEGPRLESGGQLGVSRRG